MAYPICPLFLKWHILFLCFVLKHLDRPTSSASHTWQSLYGEKTVRKAERARFLSEGEENEALIRVAFDSLGQKQRVFEPYSLSLSSNVASSIPKDIKSTIIYHGIGDASIAFHDLSIQMITNIIL